MKQHPPLICVEHGIEMQRVLEPNQRHLAPLRRCSLCCAEFRAAVAKAMLPRGKYVHHQKQRVLPPVIMSERWP